jgi:hypothetical protein
MRLRNLGLIDTRVFLHAENERLAEHLSEHFGARVTALPIPAFDVPQTPKRSDNTMNVVYLGAARTEKGFCAIPEFVRDVLSIRPAINIHFYIQITPQILGYTPDVAEAVNQLRLLEERRVTLIENPLSSDGYRSMLSLADVMLLMYEPDRYRVRSSGLAVEAVLSQASVLARADTFPAHLAGPSGIALENGDDPRDALQKLYVEWPYYSVKAQERRSWYLRNHSPEIFTDQILSRRGSFVQDYIVPGAYRYESANAWKRLL